MANKKVDSKVKAAGVAAAAVTLVMYVLGQVEFIASMPEVVAGALATVVAFGVVTVAGYVKRNNPFD